MAAGLLGVGTIAGCGGATASTSSAKTPALAITSPALTARGALPALYTCSGRNIWPTLKWGALPAGTAELALFLLDLGHSQPVGGGSVEASITVGWSVRGLSPTLHAMSAGRLPAGASTGPKRYSICPPKGGTGEYMFRLYALPKRLSVPRNLSDLELFRKVNRANLAAGGLISIYTRS